MQKKIPKTGRDKELLRQERLEATAHQKRIKIHETSKVVQRVKGGAGTSFLAHWGVEKKSCQERILEERARRFGSEKGSGVYKRKTIPEQTTQSFWKNLYRRKSRGRAEPNMVENL